MADQYTDIAALAMVLRRHMEEQGLSLSELARNAGVSKSTLSKILSGRTSPYVHTLYQLCEALGISLAEALSEEESVQWDVESYGFTNREVEMILAIRDLPVGKRRWLDESLALLTASTQDIFLE